MSVLLLCPLGRKGVRSVLRHLRNCGKWIPNASYTDQTFSPSPSDGLIAEKHRSDSSNDFLPPVVAFESIASKKTLAVEISDRRKERCSIKGKRESVIDRNGSLPLAAATWGGVDKRGRGPNILLEVIRSRGNLCSQRG